MKSILLTLCFILKIVIIAGIATEELGDTKQCACDKTGEKCEVDGYVGSDVIYEDDYVRVWNFTLDPGEMISMH